MAISFVHFLAQLIIAMALLRLVAAKLIANNPESPLGKALTFVA